MKMKKKLCSLLALLCILSLTACGANSKIAADSNTPSAPQDMPTMSADSAPSAGWDAPMSEEGAFLPEPSPDAGYGGVPANAKIIYTATLSLETKEFDAASQALAALVSDVGGYFESRSVDQGHYRSMDAVVRVPAAEFLSFLDRAGETAHVANRAEYLDDVSEAYYDQESRLATQRTKLERLQELLRQAQDMEDIITIESAISETELEIEFLTGSLRKYDSQINYSTITLSLREVYRLSTDEEVPVTFAQRLSAAFAAGFHRGVEGLEDFIIGLAQIWVLLVILAVGALIVVLVLRSCRKRKPLARGPEAGRMPAPPAPEAKKAEKED